MLSAAMIRLLASKGLSLDDIAEAAEQAERDAALRNAVTPERSSAALRQARYRQRKATETPESVTCDVTRDVTLIVPLSKDKELETPKPEREAKTSRVLRGTRLPADWQPSPELIAYGTKLGFTAKQFDNEVEKFRNHWWSEPGAKGVKLDWSATFRKWLLQGSERLARNQRPTITSAPVTTAAATWVRRGSDAWNAWSRYRGTEPVWVYERGEEGQWMRSEWPPSAKVLSA